MTAHDNGDGVKDGQGQEDVVLRQLLASASEVFNRPVDADQNFFDLGGDSITAVELSLLIEERLGVQPDIAELLDADDLASYARELTAQAAHQAQT